MPAGIGTTCFMSWLRKHTAGGHKKAPDFKKAKGQFRPVFFSYFQLLDFCKSSTGGTDACMANSAVPTVDQFYLAASH